MIDFKHISSPCYLIDEKKLRNNLSVIAGVTKATGVEIILALKANAMWKLFPIIREYVSGTTASSLNEARLAYEEFGSKTYTYAPVYKDSEIEKILDYSSHIVFNSVAQFQKYKSLALAKSVSSGLRINPEYSSVEKDIYNPCSAGSRLGVTYNQLEVLPEGIEGLLFHSLCESNPENLANTLKSVKKYYAHILPKIKWLDMGGGHLMTRKGYDIEELILILTTFKKEYPHLHIILEPGSAFTWETGWLISKIEDIVENKGINTLMLDVSFTCHMPDTLEMPYKPSIIGAHESKHGEKKWRLGGNSCLAGDFIGDYTFDKEPKVGDNIIFEDMIHYTVVKTTFFNGVSHPAIAISDMNNEIRVIKEFNYDDFKNRMS